MIRAALLGTLAGGLVAGVLVWRQKRRLEDRALLLQRALSTQGGELEAVLAQGGSALQADLERDARDYTRVVAQRTAEAVLGGEYGLTPERMRRLQVTADALTQASLVAARTAASIMS